MRSPGAEPWCPISTIQKDVHKTHLKLVPKRIRWEKVRKGAEEKWNGRKSQNKRNGEREAQQKNVWVTFLLKLSVKFKNPTVFYLWTWKDERSKEQKVVTFMFTHKYLEGTYPCLTTSFSTWKCKHKLSKGFEVQKSQQNKEFWAEAERCLQCWRNMSARQQRQKIRLLILWVLLVLRASLNPWGEFVMECQRAAGQPVSQLCWPQVHLVSTHFQGWKAGSECSSQGEIKQKRLCSHPQCCWAQEKMLLQPKHPKKTDLAVGDIEKSSRHCPVQLVLGGSAWVERLIRPWEVSSHSRYSVVPQFYFST